MPYIIEVKRKYYSKLMEELIKDIKHRMIYYRERDVGVLNYIITKLLMATFPESYSDYNELIGVLECVKQELYRRKIAKYEDEKIKENGDIYNE